MQTTKFEDEVARKFRLQQAPTRLAQLQMASPIAFSRLRVEGGHTGRTIAASPDDAFAFQIALAPMSRGEIWIEGKYGKLQASPGDTFVFSLTANPVANLVPPYDFLRFYLPVTTLDQLAYDRGLRRIGGVRTNSVGNPDPTMRGLALSLLPLFENPSAGATLFLDSVALAFHAHVMRAYGDAREGDAAVRAGLMPWQLRRAQAFFDAHLDGDPSLADLARECRLSPSHFARAFRQATGVPPHRWLMRRRVERAKELLLDGDLGLAQIAVACGFSDQSHLTRVFTRHETYGPGKWRRLRRN